MASCSCTRKIVRYFDLSGIQVDNEFGIQISQISKITNEIVLSPRSYDHQETCLMVHMLPKAIDLSEFPKKNTSHKGNGKYKGPFAFTITKSPKDSFTVADMLIAARKIMNQKSCPVARYAWHYEDKGRDDNGDPLHPHIHGMYETNTLGRIEAKYWKRVWPIWDETIKCGVGFRGGYHREVMSEDSYDKYIKKDGGMGESFPPDK